MAKNERAIVGGLVLNRKNLIELIVLAVLLAFGVNLVTGNILALTKLSSLVSISLGAGICAGSVLYLATRLFGKRVARHSYEAFLIYNEKKNEIIPVPRYEFSEDLHYYLKSAFVENSALKVLWGKEPLKDTRIKPAILLKAVLDFSVLNGIGEIVGLIASELPKITEELKRIVIPKRKMTGKD